MRNINTTIGVVGHGFVGGAVAKGFELFSEVKIYDVVPEKSTHSFEEVVNCDFVFIALPTPMVSAEGGEANLSIMKSFFEKVAPFAQQNKTIYVIKSTVPVGTTRMLSKKYGIKRLLHNPEFLRERSAIEDFFNPSRNVIGGDDKESVEKMAVLLTTRFPGVPCYLMSPSDSEMVKYMANSFLGTKIIFFNEMKLLAEAANLNWDMVVKGVTSDERIGKSCSQVPGVDGDRAFGGTCIPKDLNALIATMESFKIDPLLLKAVWQQNKKLRNNWDWAKNPSAVQKDKI